MRNHLTTITVTLALATASLGLAACGDDREVDLARPPDDPDAVVVQVGVSVNQPNPIAIATGHPPFTLYGDGRLIVRDRTVESEGLLPLVEARVSPEGVQALLTAAVDALLGADRSEYDGPPVADADAYRLTITTADAPTQTLRGEWIDQVRRALDDWRSIVGDHLVDEPVLYTGDTVLAIGSVRHLDELDEAFVELFRGADTFDARAGRVVCAELTGDALDELLPTIATESYGPIGFRQLLPQESGCDLIDEA
jgi:hypothetical protein